MLTQVILLFVSAFTLGALVGWVLKEFVDAPMGDEDD